MRYKNLSNFWIGLKDFLASFITFHSFGLIVHLLHGPASGLLSALFPATAGSYSQQTRSDKPAVHYLPGAKKQKDKVKPDFFSWIRTKVEIENWTSYTRF